MPVMIPVTYMLAWRFYRYLAGLNYWRYLAMIVDLPILKPLVAFAYNRFADYRFSRLTHCQIAARTAK